MGLPAVLLCYIIFLILLLVPASWARLRRLLLAEGSSTTAPARSRPGAGLLVLLGICSFVVFMLLSNRFINCDGLQHLSEIPARGRCGCHDEMWTPLAIGALWRLLHNALGWSITTAFNIWSSLSGAFFVCLPGLFAYGRTGCRYGRPFLVLVMSAGFMQLFFGDVESYAFVAFLILCYLYAGLENLRDGVTVVLPTVLLTLACTFHMLAGWLLHSLLFLHWRALRRHRYARIGLSLLLSLVIVGLTLVVMETTGLHLISIRGSHFMGTADRGLTDMFLEGSLTYYVNLVNLLFLLLPTFWIAIPMFVSGRIRMNETNLFLVISAGMLILLLALWRAGLGPYHDWNLYASLGVPLSLLLWTNLLGTAGTLRYRARIVAAVVFTNAIHSYSWIVSNHFHVPD